MLITKLNDVKYLTGKNIVFIFVKLKLIIMREYFVNFFVYAFVALFVTLLGFLCYSDWGASAGAFIAGTFAGLCSVLAYEMGKNSFSVLRIIIGIIASLLASGIAAWGITLG